MTPIHVVLVRPIYARNVGMCARAMANLGAQRLFIIAPQCAINEEARQGAAGAQQALTAATFYQSLEEFYQNEGGGLYVALSARTTRGGPAQLLDETLERTLAAADLRPFSDRPIYLIFGPEDDGLTTQDCALAHHVCALPVYGEFTSYNLSHAVTLSLYIAQSLETHADMGQPTAKEKILTATSQNTASNKTQAATPRFFPEKTIDAWVEAVGFDLENRKTNAATIFKRILLENAPTENDLKVLEAILQQNIRKLGKVRES